MGHADTIALQAGRTGGEGGWVSNKGGPRRVWPSRGTRRPPPGQRCWLAPSLALQLHSYAAPSRWGGPQRPPSAPRDQLWQMEWYDTVALHEPFKRRHWQAGSPTPRGGSAPGRAARRGLAAAPRIAHPGWGAHPIEAEPWGRLQAPRHLALRLPPRLTLRGHCCRELRVCWQGSGASSAY